jgi:type IV secretory pathway TrbD component
MEPSPNSLRPEIYLAGVVCGIGLIWSAQTWSTSYWGLRGLALTPGPLESCGVGIVIWLLARWQLVRHKKLETNCLTAEPQ